MMLSKPAWSIGARQGPLRRHKQLVFFACEGLVVLRDEREHRQDADYETLTPTDFERRANGLGVFASKCKAADPPWLREEGRLCEKAANEMLETVTEARNMGDPSDPAVQSFWARHRGRKSTVSLRAGTDAAGYPDLPGVDRGPRTGRTAEPGQQMDTTVAEANHVRIHKPPKKKPRSGLILNL